MKKKLVEKALGGYYVTGMGTYKPKKIKKYWYKTIIRSCVLCGYETKERFRVYDEPKPEFTITWEEFACGEHFM